MTRGLDRQGKRGGLPGLKSETWSTHVPVVAWGHEMWATRLTFPRTDPAADLKAAYFRCQESESPTGAVQSVFQSMLRDCSALSLGSAFDLDRTCH